MGSIQFKEITVDENLMQVCFYFGKKKMIAAIVIECMSKISQFVGLEIIVINYRYVMPFWKFFLSQNGGAAPPLLLHSQYFGKKTRKK